MEMTKKEFLVQDDSPVLKEFIKTNSEQLEGLVKDSKTAQVSLQPAHIKLTLELLYTNISCWFFFFMLSVLSGGVCRRGGVFRRKPQNHAAVHVFPAVWAFHSGLQGEDVQQMIYFFVCINHTLVAVHINPILLD